MNINEFRSELINYLNNTLTDAEAGENDVIKNNGLRLRGIVIKRPDVIVSPSIYIENFYQRYINGEKIEEIAEDIIELDNVYRFRGEFNPEEFFDFKCIKDLLRIKLINTADNEELLENIPSRKFMDLSEVVYCDVSNMINADGTILVRNEHMNKWGVDTEELIDTAYNNTRNYGVDIEDIADVIGAISDDKECFFRDEEFKNRMYVMRCGKKMFGASGMLFDDVLDEFLKDRCQGVYIVPSSIHEVIILPDSGEYEGEYINDMIKTVNKENLDAEDVLSSHAYYYSSEDGYSIV